MSASTESKGFPVIDRYSSPMKKSLEPMSSVGTTDTPKPKRTNSLRLFFRKVIFTNTKYYIAK